MSENCNSNTRQNYTGKVAIVLAIISILLASIAFVVANANINFPSMRFSYDKLGEFIGMFFSVIGVFFSIYFIVIGVSVNKFQRELLADQEEVSKLLEEFTKKQKELDAKQKDLNKSQDTLNESIKKLEFIKNKFQNRLQESIDINERSKEMLRRNAQDVYDFYSSLLGIMRGLGGIDKINEIELQKARFVCTAAELLKDDVKLSAAISKLGDLSNSYEDIDLLRRIADAPQLKIQANGIIGLIENRIQNIDEVIIWDEGSATE